VSLLRNISKLSWGTLPSCSLQLEGTLLGVMVHSYNPSTGETEAGELWVQEQCGLHSETVSKKKKIKESFL
jgi:hypothetical protein